jgi:hypothetical protein
LDIKVGACADIAVAHKIINEISAMVGQRPAYIVETGHGLHAVWAIEDGDITDTFTTADASALSARFGRLAAVVAESYGADIDTVSDTARVLRVAGTMNVGKGDPVRVVGRADVGAPLSVAELSERLDEWGVFPQPDDATEAEQLSDPVGWKYATETCAYVVTMIDGWATDTPIKRNPWACSQSLRLHCAWRLGCIHESDFERAKAQLEECLESLLASTEPRRKLRRYEMRDIHKLGRKRASEKTDEAARAELGGHVHTGPADFLDAGSNANGLTASASPSEAAPPLSKVLLSRSKLRTLPDPEPLIDNVFDKGTCALLYGHGGTFKTFIALDWALSVAIGRRWQGRATEQCKVLYNAAEGAFGYKARIAAWETGWKTPIDDENFALLPHPVNLYLPGDVAKLGALIEWGGYSFVVIDTMARCMVGADENSAKDTGLIVDRLYWLLSRTPGGRGVVTGVHHTGKDAKTLRGSSALEAGVDTVYSTTRDGGDVIGVRCLSLSRRVIALRPPWRPVRQPRCCATPRRPSPTPRVLSTTSIES